jgi:N-acetylmuramic acid 6-phosphate (MurNAc-6-P) etherase
LLVEAQSVKTAIAMQKLRISRSIAEQRLADAGGSLSKLLSANS